MPDFDYRVVFDSVAWEEPMPGLRFKARRDNGKQLRLVEYGREMEPHWCEKGHLGYILDGRFEIAFDSGGGRLRTGATGSSFRPAGHTGTWASRLPRLSGRS